MTAARQRRYAAGRARTLGLATRGTTNPNRLRRVDRWLISDRLVSRALAARPLVIDLGYGATPVTTVEMAGRLRARFPGVAVVGLEIDPERVEAALPHADPPLLTFERGGFEFRGMRPGVVRAFNVLRQYEESAARQAWRTMTDRLTPEGVLIEGTCDEIGRRCCWVTLTRQGPVSVTISVRASDISAPSDVAPRLPKALIHRNVPGERVHEMFTALDRCWAESAPLAPFGPRARWVEAVDRLRRTGWPVLDNRGRWRLGELTLAWEAVAPYV